MELRPIADLEQWYARELTEAFPPNERKPLAEIRALLEGGDEPAESEDVNEE